MEHKSSKYFDWKYYLNKYDDLKKLKFEEKEAKWHYYLSHNPITGSIGPGMQENRLFNPFLEKFNLNEFLIDFPYFKNLRIYEIHVEYLDFLIYNNLLHLADKNHVRKEKLNVQPITVHKPISIKRNHNVAVAILIRNPAIGWIKFLSKFKNYDTYLIIDDNLKKYYSNSSVNYYQVNDDECINNGYQYSTKEYNPSSKPVISWDKALYYFCEINTNYDFVWFIEDDVLFYEENDLLYYENNEYKNIDFLCNGVSPRSTNYNGWLWPKFSHNIKLPDPHFMSLVQATRMSKKMLNSIKTYINKHKRLFFIEGFFATICIHNNLTHKSVKMNHIVNNKIEQLKRNHFNHPIKDLSIHNKLLK